MYEFKNLPKVSSEEFALSPRDRVIPNNQTPGEPAELSLEDAEQLRGKRTAKAAAYDQDARHGSNSRQSYGTNRGQRSDNRDNHYGKSEHESPDSTDSDADEYEDPWAKWR